MLWCIINGMQEILDLFSLSFLLLTMEGKIRQDSDISGTSYITVTRLSILTTFISR